MKKLHLVFIILYIVIAAIATWSMYLESFRDTWILGIVIFIGIVLSIFSHVKLLKSPFNTKGEKTFMWLTLINLLLPVLGMLFINQIMSCGGVGLSCMVAFVIVLGGTGLLWVVTVVAGLRSVLENKVNFPTQTI